MEELETLLEENRSQLERELGGAFRFGDARPGEGVCVLRQGADQARLVYDRTGRRLIMEGPDIDSLYEAWSLIRELWGHPGGTIPVADAGSPEEAAARIERSLASTWPSFELRGIDWSALCEEWIPRVVEAEDPIPVMKQWVAQLGDPHTAVRPVDPPGRLPYRARKVGGSVVFFDVPTGTAGHRAGARPGDALAGVDLEALTNQYASRPHSHDLLVGLAAVRGPLGSSVEVTTESGLTWTETFELVPWPEPLETGRLDDETAYIRLRVWMTDLEEAFHDALDHAAGAARLVLDLRGNGGGNYMMATRARGRFLDGTRQVGWIRYRHPGGGMTDLEPIIGARTDVFETWTTPTAMWIDPESYSATEDFLLGLSEQSNICLLGEASGGGSGRLRSVRLLPGWQLTITTCHTFANDGAIIEGDGHPVAGRIPESFA